MITLKILSKIFAFRIANPNIIANFAVGKYIPIQANKI